MTSKITLNIDKAMYVDGENVKIKIDYATPNQKQTIHVAVLDPSEKEVFSADQFVNTPKIDYSMVLRFDTRKWGTPGRYKVTVWDQEGARKEVFFQLKAKG